MTVNSFFAHFVKEIDIRRYDDNLRILPTNNTVEIYRYSDAMLKHMPDGSLKPYDETLLCNKKAVKLANNVDRCPDNTENSRTDDNLDDQIDKLHDLLGKKEIYRIPLRILIEQNTSKNFNRFRSSKFCNIFRRKIYFYLRARFETTFISYPEIQLNENFEAYFNSFLRSKKALRTGIKVTSYQQSFEINIGFQNLFVNFVGANRQFALLELSLVYDKNDQHKTIYNSYNAEVATKKIKSLKIGNSSSTYALRNEIK